MRCFWCGEEIDDDATKCKYCGIKIDKEAIEKKRLAEEKEKKEFNVLGAFGLVLGMIPIAFFTDLFSMMSYEQNENLMNKVLLVMCSIGFICSFIGIIIDKKNKNKDSLIYSFVGFIFNLLWVLLFFNVIIKGAALLSTVGLVIFLVNQKVDK